MNYELNHLKCLAECLTLKKWQMIIIIMLLLILMIMLLLIVYLRKNGMQLSLPSIHTVDILLFIIYFKIMLGIYLFVDLSFQVLTVVIII